MHWVKQCPPDPRALRTSERGHMWKRLFVDVTDSDEVRLEQGQPSALGPPQNRRRGCGDRGRGWSEAAASPGAPRTAGRTQPAAALEGSTPETSGPGLPGFQPPGLQNCQRTQFCCFKPLYSIVFCYSIHRQLIQRVNKSIYFNS